MTIQEEVNRLTSKGCQCDSLSHNNDRVFLPSDMQTVKDAVMFDLQLEIKQQNDSVMHEISKMEMDVRDTKAKVGAAAMTISGLVSSGRYGVSSKR
jgi:hypothetical protein